MLHGTETRWRQQTRLFTIVATHINAIYCGRCQCGVYPGERAGCTAPKLLDRRVGTIKAQIFNCTDGIPINFSYWRCAQFYHRPPRSRPSALPAAYATRHMRGIRLLYMLSIIHRNELQRLASRQRRLDDIAGSIQRVVPSAVSPQSPASRAT